MQNLVVWQDLNEHTFVVVGEWPEPVTITARSTITSYYSGVAVGFFYRNGFSFGYWSSSNRCDPITAWRVAHILPRVQTLRSRLSGYDSTLSGLVIAMQGDRHQDRMRERAKDLGLTIEALDAELLRLGQLWPSARLLLSMWIKLPQPQQDEHAQRVRQAIVDGHVAALPDLVHEIELAELRLRSKQDQQAHEDQLIAAGLEPAVSLRQLMTDIGVTNLAYTVGYEEMFEPSHFQMNDLDHQIMKELIGGHGFASRVPLLTTQKQPDDPSAHHIAGGGGITLRTSDYGNITHPRITLAGDPKELVYVRYDRVTERFQLTLRPVGIRNEDEDILLSIEELRWAIGADMGSDGPLEPGQSPPWCLPPDDSDEPAEAPKPRRRFWRRGKN